MGRRSKLKGKTLSLKDFHNSPSIVVPQPSPAPIMESLENQREIWKNNPSSVLTPPTREEKETMLQIPKKRISIPEPTLPHSSYNPM